MKRLTPKHEKYWQNKINRKYKSGETEIKCRFGYVDFMTKTYCWEIKKYDDFKHAIGQVLAYSFYFRKKPAILLFSEPKKPDPQIKKLCKKLNIKLVYSKHL